VLSWDSAYLDGFSAGVQQGTNLGPILFVIMINDLKIVSPRSSNLKYVDDVTISEIVPTRELGRYLYYKTNWTQLVIGQVPII
jgi:hypothetical protein